MARGGHKHHSCDACIVRCEAEEAGPGGLGAGAEEVELQGEIEGAEEDEDGGAEWGGAFCTAGAGDAGFFL